MAQLRILTHLGILWTAVVIILITSGMSASTGAVDLFVSGHGRDMWSGKRADPGENDGPFATIERAQQAVREVRKTDPQATVRVIMRGGTYYLDSSVRSGGFRNAGCAGCLCGRTRRKGCCKRGPPPQRRQMGQGKRSEDLGRRCSGC